MGKILRKTWNRNKMQYNSDSMARTAFNMNISKMIKGPSHRITLWEAKINERDE
jgi:hypothetical protein